MSVNCKSVQKYSWASLREVLSARHDSRGGVVAHLRSWTI